MLAQEKEQLSNKVYDYSIGRLRPKFIVDKLMNFNLSPGIWIKLMEENGWAIKTCHCADFGRAL